MSNITLDNINLETLDKCYCDLCDTKQQKSLKLCVRIPTTEMRYGIKDYDYNWSGTKRIIKGEVLPLREGFDICVDCIKSINKNLTK